MLLLCDVDYMADEEPSAVTLADVPITTTGDDPAATIHVTIANDDDHLSVDNALLTARTRRSDDHSRAVDELLVDDIHGAATNAMDGTDGASTTATSIDASSSSATVADIPVSSSLDAMLHVHSDPSSSSSISETKASSIITHGDLPLASAPATPTDAASSSSIIIAPPVASPVVHGYRSLQSEWDIEMANITDAKQLKWLKRAAADVDDPSDDSDDDELLDDHGKIRIATSHAEALQFEEEKKKRRAARRQQQGGGGGRHQRSHATHTTSANRGDDDNDGETKRSSPTITTINVQQTEFQWTPLEGDQWTPEGASANPSADVIYRDTEHSKLHAFKFYRMTEQIGSMFKPYVHSFPIPLSVHHHQVLDTASCCFCCCYARVMAMTALVTTYVRLCGVPAEGHHELVFLNALIYKQPSSDGAGAVLAGSFLNASMVLLAIIVLTLIFVCLLLVNRRPVHMHCKHMIEIYHDTCLIVVIESVVWSVNHRSWWSMGLFLLVIATCHILPSLHHTD